MSPPNTNSENINITGLSIHAGTSSGAAIVMVLNGKHIVVSIFSGQTLEDRLIRLLGQATSLDESEAALDEALPVINDAAKLHFLQVAPPAPSPSDETIHSLLYPEMFYFRFHTVHGTPTIVPIRASEAYIVPDKPVDNLDIDFSVDGNLPQYPSTQVRVLEAFARVSRFVSRVLVNGEVLFCKAAKTGLFDPNVQRELDSLQRVEKARATSSFASIRIPRLRGYVTHAESGHIIGLLREWIPSDFMHGYSRCLSDLDVGTISRERRHQWAAQICETVHQLHEIGLVWGDGKIQNVVIDKEDNAWLIDFGGGWTRDWVDCGLADTVEGDEQALRNIFKFLHMDEYTAIV